MNFDSIGDRMKSYENAYRIYFPRRLPIIVRIDGRAFHTFTRGFVKPFDDVFRKSMQDTAKALCESVAGCKLAYVQSDEISLLVTNDDTIETQPWFDNVLCKIVSITASTATLAFDAAFEKHLDAWSEDKFPGWENGGTNRKINEDYLMQLKLYGKSRHAATFDSRAFIIPVNEVANYFICRQQDAVRNSIQMVAQSLYSHRELQGKNSAELQEMVFQKGTNWNDYPVECKRGACIVRAVEEINGAVRHKWKIDTNIPTFTKNREYIEKSFIYEEGHQ